MRIHGVSDRGSSGGHTDQSSPAQEPRDCHVNTGLGLSEYLITQHHTLGPITNRQHFISLFFFSNLVIISLVLNIFYVLRYKLRYTLLYSSPLLLRIELEDIFGNYVWMWRMKYLCIYSCMEGGREGGFVIVASKPGLMVVDTLCWCCCHREIAATRWCLQSPMSPVPTHHSQPGINCNF